MYSIFGRQQSPEHAPNLDASNTLHVCPARASICIGVPTFSHPPPVCDVPTSLVPPADPIPNTSCVHDVPLSPSTMPSIEGRTGNRPAHQRSPGRLFLSTFSAACALTEGGRGAWQARLSRGTCPRDPSSTPAFLQGCAGVLGLGLTTVSGEDGRKQQEREERQLLGQKQRAAAAAAADVV